MTFKKTDLFPHLLFFTAFTTYLFTATPNIYWRDAAEFQTVGFLLDIAHPSGSPLYAVVAKLFTLMPLGSIAFKTTILSAFFGAVIVALLYLIIRMILGQLSSDHEGLSQPSPRFIQCLSLACSALFLFSPALWQNATVPEVYTFQNFFTTLFIFLLLKVMSKPANDASPLQVFQIFMCLVFLLGLSLGAHSILILYLPLLLVFVYFIWLRPASRPFLKTYALLAFFFCIGFSIYLYLPIRSTQNPYYDWGDSETFNNLMAHVSDKKDASYHFSFPADRIVSQLKLYAGFYFDNFSFLGVLFGGLGLLSLIRKKMWRLFALFALFALPPFLFFIRWWWEESAFIPNFLIFSILIGMGVFSVYKYLKNKVGRNPRWPVYLNIVWVLFGIQLVLLVSSHAEKSNKADYWAPRTLMKEILSDLDPNAIVFSGRTAFPFNYLQQIEGYRPDLSLIGVASFQAPELFVQVDQHKFPDIMIPKVAANQLGSAFLNQNIDEHPIYWEPDTQNNGLVEKYLLPDAFLFKLARNPAPLNSEGIRTYLETLSKQIHFDQDIEDYQERLFYALTIVSQGRFFLERGAAETARRHFEMVVELIPNDSHFQNILAVSYENLGQFDKAESYFFKSIALAPENIAPYLNLGRMYANQGSMADAEKFFKEARDIRPDHIDAIVSLGKLNADRGDRAIAMSYFEQALKHSPGNTSVMQEIKSLEADHAGE